MKKYWSAGKEIPGVNVTLKRTSSPVTGPSPPVVWFGFGWIPVSTELAAVKDGLSTVAAKLSVWLAVSRSTNSTSDGLLTRVGTSGVRDVFESFGNTR